MTSQEAHDHLLRAARLGVEDGAPYLISVFEEEPGAVISVIRAARSYLDAKGALRPGAPEVVALLRQLKESLLE